MRNAAVYILIRFVSQGAVFVATLIVARILPIEAFAQIGSALLLQAVLIPLSGLSLHSALERFYFSYEDLQRPGKIFTMWVASLAVNIAFAALAFLAIAILQRSFLEPWQAAAILFATVLQSSQYVPTVVMRCREEMKTFAAMQLAFVLLTQSTIVVWIAVDRSVDAWFYGMLAGSAAAFLMWASWVFLATSGRRLLGITDEIRYVLPVVPISILEAVQQTVDRYVLQATVPASEFATFSLAQRFASPIATLSSGAKSAMYPLLYRSRTPEEAGQMLVATTNASIAAFGVLTCLSAVVFAFILHFFLPPEYAIVFPFFLAVGAGYFVRGQEVLLGVGPDITMQQGKKLSRLSPVLFLQIAVAATLTFTLGIWGAAVAFMLNSIIRTYTMSALGQKLLPRDIDRADYWAATLSSLLGLLAFGLGSMDSMPVGPELAVIVAPLAVLAYLLRKGRRPHH